MNNYRLYTYDIIISALLKDLFFYIKFFILISSEEFISNFIMQKILYVIWIFKRNISTWTKFFMSYFTRFTIAVFNR